MINWQEVPFIRLLLPFILGLLTSAFGYFQSIPSSYLLGSLVLVFIVFFWTSSQTFSYRFRQISGLILMLLLYLLGQVVWRIQTPGYATQHYVHPEVSEATFLFRVNEQKPSRSGKSQRLQITILGIETQPGVLQQVKGASFCYLPADINIEIGACILAKGRLDTIAAPTHPGSFDFAQYMALQGMIRQLQLTGDCAYILPEDPFPSSWTLLKKVSSQLQQRLSQRLSEPAAGLVVALVLGQKNQLDSEVREDYTQVGAMHVLAVSGMHVGILAMGLSYLLSFWTGGRTYIRLIKGLIAVSVIWIFALLTGGAPSVLRAATMFSLFSLGKQLYLSQNIWNILAATALLMLCAQSRAIFTVGFQLSFLAVAAIVYFQPKLAQIIPVKNQVANYLWQLFTLGIAAQLGTAVLSIHYFHQFPVYFWLSGLVIVPLATIALLLGISVLILADVPVLGSFLAKVLQHLVQLMNNAMAWISDLPNSTLQQLQISTELCLLLLSLLFLSILWVEFRSKGLVYLIFSVTLLIGIQHYSQQIKWSQQKELLIYRHRKHLAFSLVESQQALNFYNKKEDQNSVSYAKDSYLQYKNIRKDSSVYLNHSSGLIQWNNLQILVLQDRVDLCQLSHSSKIDLAILAPNFYCAAPISLLDQDIGTFYLHPGLSRKARLYWQEQLSTKDSVIAGIGIPTAYHLDFKH